MTSGAIIAPDGARKSTITELLEHEPLPGPVKRIYMGVNLQASSLMLPTTRLALAIKTARGGGPGMFGPPGGRPSAPPRSLPRRAARAGAGAVRLVMWLAEEWFRQL